MRRTLKGSLPARAARTARSLVAIAVLAAVSSAALADGEGTIVGIVTNATRQPVARATVTAIRVDDGAIRSTLSGSDGVYAFADLPAGTWSVTIQVAGSANVTAPQLEVVASHATRYDVVMNAAASAAVPEAASVAPAPAKSISRRWRTLGTRSSTA
jgi:hypothetical protein